MNATRTARLLLPTAAIAAAAALTACGGSSGGSAGTTTTPSAAPSTSTAAAATLHVLVTNDDGVGAPGVDAVVNALRAEPNTRVDVVAPATNQSGQGGKTTPNVTWKAAKTASGVAATAVNGHPADTITVALDKLGLKPDLVVSGINLGQNLGPVVDLSGTVGAARAAVRHGVPALAISQGLGAKLDYPAGVKEMLDWIASRRQDAAAHRLAASSVANMNVPSCAKGAVRGVKELPSEAKITDIAQAIKAQDCTSTAVPTAEVAAFNAGFVTVTSVSPNPGS